MPGSLDFGRVATILRTDKSGSLCLNCLHKPYGVRNTPFPSGSLEVWYVAEATCVTSPLSKNPGRAVSRASLAGNMPQSCHNRLLGDIGHPV